MEFEHVGGRCANKECLKQDFLPIHCDKCQLDFCDAHYVCQLHPCTSYLKKDIISYACPLCEYSIKLTRADNADEKWQEHFVSTCPQGPNGHLLRNTATAVSSINKKTEARCARSDCRAGVLGPGNSMKCSKCGQLVCISHRLPEEHPCSLSNNNRNAVAIQKRLEALNKTQTSKPTIESNVDNIQNASKPNFKQKNNNKNVKSSSNSFSNSNTAASTADRRRKIITKNVYVNGALHTYTIKPGETSTITHGPISFSIRNNNGNEVLNPISNIPPRVVGSDVYVDFELNSLDNFTATTGNNDGNMRVNSSVSTSGTGNEVCPQCNARFNDVMLLIEHVESVHSGSSNGAVADNSATAGSNKECLVM